MPCARCERHILKMLGAKVNVACRAVESISNMSCAKVKWRAVEKTYFEDVWRQGQCCLPRGGTYSENA